MDKKTTMLMILDGFGINEKEEGNAVKSANIPNIERILKQYPNTIIHTSGLDVGLPDGQMGNSEVGHTNIGAGRIIYQELTRITKSIEDGDFFSISEFITAIENCKKNNTKLHIMGLLSDGGVHSHQRHLYGLLELAKRKDFEECYDSFDLEKVCSYGEEKVKELLSNKKIIRNRLKINASIHNANIFRKIKEEYGTFYEYLKVFTKGNIIYEVGVTSSALSDVISNDLKKRGMKFVGTTIIYSYLQAIGVIYSHEKNCFMYKNK